ncbi:hypothetical protein GUJ93_ZPchr0015g6881 [Zizania palustris]|uniref:Vesicle-fusing ATPase n=1 Tax=Zizania palustris TaxID=103762 RepID=A0A8J5TGI0_ZIZPA|nr:hypothetical protein GUJ93_ZPchr0015g6881 [Zizania palustris]
MTRSLTEGNTSATLFQDTGFPPIASKVFPHVVNKLGIKHVKGILLYGPLVVAKLLNGNEPKIVNGPEVLSKFVGESEKNARDLFADAQNDHRI